MLIVNHSDGTSTVIKREKDGTFESMEILEERISDKDLEQYLEGELTHIDEKELEDMKIQYARKKLLPALKKLEDLERRIELLENN